MQFCAPIRGHGHASHCAYSHGPAVDVVLIGIVRVRAAHTAGLAASRLDAPLPDPGAETGASEGFAAGWPAIWPTL